MAVAILTVAIVMVISASPPNYLHHHINEDPTLLIPPANLSFVTISTWKALGRFILAQIAQKGLFWGARCAPFRCLQCI